MIAFNVPTDDLEKSYLSLATSAGVTALPLKNTDRFAANDRIMIGEMGREKTELVTVSANASATSLTIGATVFPHSADDPVYRLRFDQIKFYRSTTGINGSYPVQSTQDMDVDNENLTTTYIAADDAAGYYYKISYYNSISTIESAFSDPVLVAGYPRGSVGFLIDEILREVGDEEEQFITRNEILGWFNEVNDDLTTRRRKPYSFLHVRSAQTRTANATTLSFVIGMWKHDRLETVFTDTSGTDVTYPVRVISLPEFREKYGDSSGGDANDELQVIALDDTVSAYRLWPRSKTTTANAFYIYYWKTFDELDSEGDIFETPTPRIYKMFGLYKFYNKKSMGDFTQASTATSFLNQYNTEIIGLNRAQGLDAGSPTGFKYLPQDFRGNRRF